MWFVIGIYLKSAYKAQHVQFLGARKSFHSQEAFVFRRAHRDQRNATAKQWWRTSIKRASTKRRGRRLNFDSLMIVYS